MLLRFELRRRGVFMDTVDNFSCVRKRGAPIRYSTRIYGRFVAFSQACLEFVASSHLSKRTRAATSLGMILTRTSGWQEEYWLLPVTPNHGCPLRVAFQVNNQPKSSQDKTICCLSDAMLQTTAEGDDLLSVTSTADCVPQQRFVWQGTLCNPISSPTRLI